MNVNKTTENLFPYTIRTRRKPFRFHRPKNCNFIAKKKKNLALTYDMILMIKNTMMAQKFPRKTVYKCFKLFLNEEWVSLII